MTLEAEQIQENWDKFIGYINTYISEPRKSQLLSFYKKYESRLITMPASYKPQFHSCWVGGYIHHCNNVVAAALRLDIIWREMGVADTYTTEELVFSALNHDLGKMGDENNEAYLPNDSEWHIRNRGELYKFNNQLMFMAVPDRSLHMLTKAGILYSDNEMLSIKLHDGLYDDANKQYLCSYNPETKPRTSLIFIIHQADMLASRIEFELDWFPKIYPKKPTPVSNKKLDIFNQVFNK